MIAVRRCETWPLANMCTVVMSPLPSPHPIPCLVILMLAWLLTYRGNVRLSTCIVQDDILDSLVLTLSEESRDMCDGLLEIREAG